MPINWQASQSASQYRLLLHSLKPAWYLDRRPLCFPPGLLLLASLSIAVGLILDTVTRGRREMKRLAYLSHVALHNGGGKSIPHR